MKKYLLPLASHTYKANLHMHTTLSDGNQTPEETRKAFMEHGYQIVAFSDHEVMIPHPELTDDSFLALTSYEIAVNDTSVPGNWDQRKTVHLNMFAPEAGMCVSPVFNEKQLWPAIEHIRSYISDEMRAVAFPLSYQRVNDIIAAANEAGFLVSLNHPVWSTQNYVDYSGYRGLWGVECHNTGCWQAGYLDTMQPIDDLLRQGEKVVPLATDDAHSLGNCFGGWVMIRADKLTHEAVFTALKNGDCYCSTGPAIEEISLEGTRLTVRCSPVRKIFVSTERRETYHTPGHPQGLMTEATFDLAGYLETRTDGKGYIRVTVEDAEGYTAHSRAYFEDELI